MNREFAAAPGIASAQPAIFRQIAAVILGSLLVGVCAHISLPLWFTPVPLTLQNGAVLFLGLTMAPSASAAALALYLLEGAAGLPVFAPFAPAGMFHIFGPTGGYLLAYPLAAALIGVLRRRMGRSFSSSLLAATAGNALILIAGAAGFALWSHQPASTVLALSIVPFLPGEVLKIVAAASAGLGISRLRRR
jgi:biotin transport system substrate-specific component